MQSMSMDTSLNLQPGTIVNGRYEVVKCLGTGSMGMVYACRHRELAGHIVAMKVLFSEVARDDVAAARFKNEIVASYEVSHPNVVRAYEYFRDGDLIAFTMEYIGGGDIADKISNSEDIPIDEIVRMLSQMCSGVQAIHDAKIIHRDLKPENILLTTQGDIKITDFGIARTGTGPKLTEHGSVVGTIDYVSPEYLERGEVDTRSDIYALGVIAYEVITHEAPFKGNSLIEAMTLKLRTDPVPPIELRSDCPPLLSDIVMRALARDPEQRFQTAREMHEALQQYTRGSSSGLPAFSSERLAAGYSGSHSSVSRDGRPGETTSRAHAGREAGSAPGYHPGGSGARIPPLGASIVQSYADELLMDNQGTSPRRKLSAIRGGLDSPDSGAASYSSPMESVLSGSRFNMPRMMNEEIPGQSVSVSSSHFSAERLKSLRYDHERSDFSGFRTTLFMCIIFVLGFGAGWIILRQFWPDLFQSSRTELNEAINAADKFE